MSYQNTDYNYWQDQYPRGRSRGWHGRRSRGKGRGQHRGRGQHGGFEQASKRAPLLNPEDSHKIMEFLSSKPSPQDATVIAKACGYNTKKEINPTLYKLKREGCLVKVAETPPMWALAHKGQPGRPQGSFDVGFLTQNSFNSPGFAFENTLNMRDAPGAYPHYQQGYAPHHSRNHAPAIPFQMDIQNSFNGRKRFPHELAQTQHWGGRQRFERKPRNVQGYQTKNTGKANDIGRSPAQKPFTTAAQTPGQETDSKRDVNRHVADVNNGNGDVSNKQSTDQTKDQQGGDLNSNQSSEGQDAFSERVENPSDDAYAEAVGGTEEDDDDDMYWDDDEDDDEFDLYDRISDFVTHPSLSDLYDSSEEETGNKMMFGQDTGMDITSTEDSPGSSSEGVAERRSRLENDSFCSTGPETDQHAPLKTKILEALYNSPMKTMDKNCLAEKLDIDTGKVDPVLDALKFEDLIMFTPAKKAKLSEKGQDLAAKQRQPPVTSDQRTLMSKRLHDGPAPSPAALLQSNPLFGGSGCNHATSNSVTIQSSEPVAGKWYAPQGVPKNTSTNYPSFTQSMANAANSLSTESNPVLSRLNTSGPLSLNKEPESVKLSSFQVRASSVSSLSSNSLSMSASGISSYSPETLGYSFPGNNEYLQICDDPRLKVSAPSGAISMPALQNQEPKQPLLTTPAVRGSGNFSLNGPIPNRAVVSSFLGSQHSSAPGTQPQTASSLLSESDFAVLNKNPISALMEYGQARQLPVVFGENNRRGPDHKPVFCYQAIVGGRPFMEVQSTTKKEGKKLAAYQAITTLIAEGSFSLPAQSSVSNMPPEHMTSHDIVASLTHKTFNKLLATIPESLSGRKVIAGLVMKTSEDDPGAVISIGSGNRCITGDKLSLYGNIINDCHAEIITRRGFMRFLYEQLLNFNQNKDHPILEKSRDRLKVKDNVTFHLYISTAPCGDGALFSRGDVETVSSVDDSRLEVVHKPVYANNSTSLLRSKIEGGEGTIPIKPHETLQTFDGLLRGERLRTMSCSDKICRWNVVGMQGALLSHFLEPIYLSSLTLGLLFNSGHLSRAVCCRLDRGEPPLNQELPRPYRLNHPRLGQVTICDPQREIQKTKSYSINWNAAEERPEVLDGTLGICHTGTEEGMFSRLSKKQMHSKFLEVAQKFGRQDLLIEGTTYHNQKLASLDFVRAKQAMNKKFESTGCGKWVSKPEEEEMFS